MGGGIIPRTAWQALPPKPTLHEQEYEVPLTEVLDYIVIHKTNLRRNLPPLDLQRRSQNSLRYPWDDIPYHYYITWDGKIYEGREMKYVGGHAGRSYESVKEKGAGNPDHITKDPDYGSIGVALAGMIHDDIPRDYASWAQIESLKWLIGYLRNEYPRITRDRVILHREVDKKITRKRKLTPYPDVQGRTNCPGNGISKQMEGL
ncbi:MAG: N-acetylmuramoyl-L-alanine amidase [Deltaproteobacteria bacterium]|nr:N-acetylmuramoyl-L-alanine amidase [Deltaproteobacteria bacterium]